MYKVKTILYTGKNCAPVLIWPFDWKANFNWLNRIAHEGLHNKNRVGEFNMFKMCELVSDLYKAKMRLGEFEAVYSTII